MLPVSCHCQVVRGAGSQSVPGGIGVAVGTLVGCDVGLDVTVGEGGLNVAVAVGGTGGVAVLVDVGTGTGVFVGTTVLVALGPPVGVAVLVGVGDIWHSGRLAWLPRQWCASALVTTKSIGRATRSPAHQNRRQFILLGAYRSSGPLSALLCR